MAEEKQLVLKLGYEGTLFHGFQKQEGVRTVQGELEKAIQTMLRIDPEITCAGRTDAGVHAESQWVSLPINLDLLEEVHAHQLVHSFNALTPEDIVVKQAFLAPQDFSARFDAQSRSYVYRIAAPDPSTLASRITWHQRASLDVKAMDKAAHLFEGEHDFTSFCKPATTQEKNKVRTIEYCGVEACKELGEKHVLIHVRATAYLHNMVRIITGTLVEVGRNKRESQSIAKILAARDRKCAGKTAPAQGLTFHHVQYPKGIFETF